LIHPKALNCRVITCDLNKKHLEKPRNPTKIGKSHLKVAAAVGFWPQGKIRRRAFKA